MTPATELRRGAAGEAVRDLQRRLVALGLRLHAPTSRASSAPRPRPPSARSRPRAGCASTAICGRETWAALVESGFSLGDRLLYFRRPMLRGDDVGELQRRLNALGFDAGREDGIFGEDTAGALTRLQRNAGLAVDGICGPATLASAAARRDARRGLGRHPSASATSCAARAGSAACRCTSNAAPGFEALGEAVVRELVGAGARGGARHVGRRRLERSRADRQPLRRRPVPRAARRRPTPRARARTSSRGASAPRPVTASRPRCRPSWPPHLAHQRRRPCGKTYAVLRETRMAAVVCELVGAATSTAMRTLVAARRPVGAAIAHGIRRGIDDRRDSTTRADRASRRSRPSPCGRWTARGARRSCGR